MKEANIGDREAAQIFACAAIKFIEVGMAIVIDTGKRFAVGRTTAEDITIFDDIPENYSDGNIVSLGELR